MDAGPSETTLVLWQYGEGRFCDSFVVLFFKMDAGWPHAVLPAHGGKLHSVLLGEYLQGPKGALKALPGCTLRDPENLRHLLEG